MTPEIVIRGGMVMGARHADLADLNPPEKRYGGYTVEVLNELGEAGLEFTTGVRHRECVEMRRAWFAQND